MSDYQPIPVDAARKVADEYRKDILLIVGWDREANKTDIVTWGREVEEKVVAANAGETITKQLGLAEATATVHEDFRREGEAAAEVDALRRKLAAVRKALEKIVIPEGVDAGVILLSWESPTHYDPEIKCQVYEHENFSPLGYALVALWRLACDK